MSESVSGTAVVMETDIWYGPNVSLSNVPSEFEKYSPITPAPRTSLDQAHKVFGPERSPIQ